MGAHGRQAHRGEGDSFYEPIIAETLTAMDMARLIRREILLHNGAKHCAALRVKNRRLFLYVQKPDAAPMFWLTQTPGFLGLFGFGWTARQVCDAIEKKVLTFCSGRRIVISTEGVRE